MKINKCIFIIVFLYLIGLSNGVYSINRWFKISPGIRFAGIAKDIASREPDNNTTTRFDFGLGFNFDIQLEKHVGIDIDILYVRKGSNVGSSGSITLHYLSIPMLFKIWYPRRKLAFVIGPVHNFLLGANGYLVSPNIDLNKSTTNIYDIGIAFGVSYVIKEYKNGMRLIGDFRFEIGLINVYNQYRPELFNRTSPYLAIGLNF